MKEKKQTSTILNSLYQKVEYFDDMQERITDICVKLDKLENEKALYQNIDMPELFEQSVFSINMETQSLELEKNLLENRMGDIDLDETIMLIEQYENNSL